MAMRVHRRRRVKLACLRHLRAICCQLWSVYTQPSSSTRCPDVKAQVVSTCHSQSLHHLQMRGSVLKGEDTSDSEGNVGSTWPFAIMERGVAIRCLGGHSIVPSKLDQAFLSTFNKCGILKSATSTTTRDIPLKSRPPALILNTFHQHH